MLIFFFFCHLKLAVENLQWIFKLLLLTFNSRIIICFFLSSLKFPMYWIIVTILCFNPLNILLRAALKSVKSNIGSTQSEFQWTTFFLSMGHLSCFLHTSSFCCHWKLNIKKRNVTWQLYSPWVFKIFNNLLIFKLQNLSLLQRMAIDTSA